MLLVAAEKLVEREQDVHSIDRIRDIVSMLENETNGRDEMISWPVFLVMLERFCAQQNWSIEYGSVEDESCAIFCRSESRMM